MKLRFASTLLAGGLFIAGCGADTAATTAVEEGAPADEMAMTDLSDTARQLTGNNEPLDAICNRAYSESDITVDLVVGLVADVGSIDDGTFNQAAFEGMEAASRCFGVATTFLESAGDDAVAQVASMVERDVDIVVTVGFQFQDATVDAAKAHPELRFIGIDQANPEALANYVAISFRDDQVGFLAGATAALMTESGTVAIVAGPDTVPPVVAIADGFEAGAKAVSDDTVVLRQHLGSFTDSAAGAQQAMLFVDAGADVVFGAAGDSGTGATLAAAGSGARVIGVDQDEYYTTFAGGAELHANMLVTSAIKRVDLGVFLTIAAMGTGEVEGGGLLLDVANGGVGYAPFHDADVPTEVAEQLEQLRLDLATGDLEVSGP